MQCKIAHMMSPARAGDISPSYCEKEWGHKGDCLITWQGQQYSVSPKGYDGHPPERVLQPTN